MEQLNLELTGFSSSLTPSSSFFRRLPSCKHAGYRMLAILKVVHRSWLGGAAQPFCKPNTASATSHLVHPSMPQPLCPCCERADSSCSGQGSVRLQREQHAVCAQTHAVPAPCHGAQVLTSIKGTPLYMAPELVQEQPYNHTVGPSPLLLGLCAGASHGLPAAQLVSVALLVGGAHSEKCKHGSLGLKPMRGWDCRSSRQPRPLDLATEAARQCLPPLGSPPFPCLLMAPRPGFLNLIFYGTQHTFMGRTHTHTHTHALGLALPATVVPPQHKLSHQCMLAAWLCGLWLHACRSVCMSNEQELMIQTLLEAI